MKFWMAILLSVGLVLACFAATEFSNINPIAIVIFGTSLWLAVDSSRIGLERYKSSIKTGKTALKAVGLTMLLGAAAGCGGGSEKWKEEVRLGDGRVIVLERETLFERGGEWARAGGGSKPKRQRIRLAPANGTKKLIVWNTTKKSPDGLPEVPLIFDIEDGEPMVMSTVHVSAACEMYSKYVYRYGLWMEETLLDTFTQRTANLLIRDGADLPQLVGVHEKQAGNAGPGKRPAPRQVGPARTVCR
jgi:hypothetical protein